MTPQGPIAPEPLRALLDRTADSPLALIGLGIPRCPASELLTVSLPEVARARPDLAIGVALLGEEDWMLREEVLWPRGIRVSRSSVPALTLLRDGAAIAHRPGGGPAFRIEAWLADLLGPAARPTADDLTDGERRALAADPGRRAQHVVVKRDRPGAREG